MKKELATVLGIGIVYSALSILATHFTRDLIYVFLIWNLILATIVFLLGIFAENDRVQKLKKGWFIAYSLVWLLMFPNAYYVLTDLIHLSRSDFFIESGYLTYLYLQDIGSYLALSSMIILVFAGVGYGYLSLVRMKRAFEKRFRTDSKEWLVLAVLFLTSIGITIGRFLRFNSWDILRPWAIAECIFSDWNWFLTGFAGLLFITLLFVHYGLRLLSKAK